MKTAILVDGAFYLQRAKKIWGSVNPEKAVYLFYQYTRAHLAMCGSELYRIFFYDCPPMTMTFVNPINHATMKYENTPEAKWRKSFHDELKAKRKIALRMGEVDTKNQTWLLSGSKLKQVLSKKITIDELKPEDVYLDIRQKGVDMRLGLDIASLSYKNQVEQIILIAGDSDFVPAAKLARREGIDFILDPMWQHIKPDLHEHIDGLRSMIRKPSAEGVFDGKIIFPHRREQEYLKANDKNTRNLKERPKELQK